MRGDSMKKEKDIEALIKYLQLEINKKYDEIYKLQDLARILFMDVDNLQAEIDKLQQQD